MPSTFTTWFKKDRLLLALLLGSLLGGCAGARGGPSSPAPPAHAINDSGDAEHGYQEVRAAEAPPAAAPADDAASPSGAPSTEASSSAPMQEQARRSRPGLGTVWGEDRTSTIRHTSFQRAEPERPFAVATLFYNDREGVRAMARESAHFDHGDSGFSVLDGAVTVRLLDDSGRTLPAFEVASRDYVVGEHGQRYIIQLQNHTGDRIEAVASVDGLDVVDGEAGSFSKRGYVIGPFDVLEIDGFRRSTETVAAFRFGSVSDSYAARKGKARNVGVIGVAFFHESGSQLSWTSGEVHRRHTADPFPGRFATPPL